MVPYTWTRPAVKNKDGVVTRQKEVDIEEACALRDDATNVTLPQLKAMVVELRGLHGASAVKGVPGKKKQVLETLAREGPPGQGREAPEPALDGMGSA
jgi:hypothetical protein